MTAESRTVSSVGSWAYKLSFFQQKQSGLVEYFLDHSGIDIYIFATYTTDEKSISWIFLCRIRTIPSIPYQ